jgi:hypothetical protein
MNEHQSECGIQNGKEHVRKIRSLLLPVTVIIVLGFSQPEFNVHRLLGDEPRQMLKSYPTNAATILA